MFHFYFDNNFSKSAIHLIILIIIYECPSDSYNLKRKPASEIQKRNTHAYKIDWLL